jgi:hypothetical protein
VSDPNSHCRSWRTCRLRAGEYQAAFSSDPAWTIVFRFYAALHLTDGYLRTKGHERFDANSHKRRWEAIEDSPELGVRFKKSYKGLKILSENVRYDPLYAAREADLQNAADHLSVVESFLRSKLKEKGVNSDEAEPSR